MSILRYGGPEPIWPGAASLVVGLLLIVGGFVCEAAGFGREGAPPALAIIGSGLFFVGCVWLGAVIGDR